MKDVKKNKKVKVFVVVGVIIIAACVFILKGIFGNKVKITAKYTLGVVNTGDIRNSLSTTGQVYSSEEQEIKSNVNSTVINVLKKKGDEVKKGDIIAILDTGDISNDLISAQINYEKAVNDYDEAVAPMDEVDKIQIETSLENAKNNLANLEKNQPITLQKAKDSLANSYDSALTTIDTNFSTLPTIINDMRKILYLTDTLAIDDILNNEENTFNLDDYLNVEIPSYWRDIINSSIFDTDSDKEIFTNLIKKATVSYKVAKDSYDKTIVDYRNLDKNSSEEEIESFLNKASEMNDLLFNSFRDLNNVYNYYIDYNNQRLRTIYSLVKTYNSTLKTDVNSISSYVSSIKNAKDSIVKAKENLDDLIINQPIELTNAKNSLKIQQANYDKAVSGLTNLEKRSYQLSINQASAKLTALQESLEDYTIRAPFDGVLSKMNISMGDSVSSNTSIGTVISNHSIAKLVFNEVDIAKLKLDQKAILTFDALEDITLTGTVSDIDTSGTTSAGVVYYTVEISFDSEHESIKPGMSVTADITIDGKEKVLIVPNNAVKTMGDKSFVEVVDYSGEVLKNTTVEAGTVTATRKDIVVGISDDSNIEVISGLDSGDVIVVRTTIEESGSKDNSTSSTNSLNSLFGGTRNSNNNGNNGFRNFNTQNRAFGSGNMGNMRSGTPPAGF